MTHGIRSAMAINNALLGASPKMQAAILNIWNKEQNFAHHNSDAGRASAPLAHKVENVREEISDCWQNMRTSTREKTMSQLKAMLEDFHSNCEQNAPLKKSYEIKSRIVTLSAIIWIKKNDSFFEEKELDCFPETSFCTFCKGQYYSSIYYKLSSTANNINIDGFHAHRIMHHGTTCFWYILGESQIDLISLIFEQ